MQRYLMTIDVARLLNCSGENVRALERSGKLRAERTPSGRRIFRGEDVERFIHEREQQKRERVTDANKKVNHSKSN